MNYSRLMAISQLQNITLKFTKEVSHPFAHSPLFTPTTQFLSSSLNFLQSRFIRNGMPVVQGHGVRLQISDCRFTESETPIHLSSTSRQSHTTRLMVADTGVRLQSTMFEFCHTAKYNGGALCLNNVESDIKSCFFFQGAAKYGGGLFAIGGRSIIQDSSFVKCIAKKGGGGAHFESVDLVLSHANFVENHADAGAAVNLIRSHVTIHDDKFYSNKAVGRFGGIYFEDCDGTMIYNWFYNNRASSDLGLSVGIGKVAALFQYERNFFFDPTPYPISISSDANVVAVNNHFSGTPGNTVFYDEVKNGVKKFEIRNDYYTHDLIGKLPALPTELLRDVYAYDAQEPKFAWRSLYLIIAVFIVVLSMLAIFTPLILQPTSQSRGWEHAEP